MSKPFKRPNAEKERIRKRLLIAGLALFFVFDIAVVSFALNPPEVPTTDAVVTPEATPTVEPEAEATPDPTPAAPAAIASAVPARVIESRDDQLAWRATTGECGAPALPELTTDGGATWTSTTAAPTGIVSLQSISIEGDRVASMIGQDADGCAPMLVRTFVAGTDYAEYPADLADAWYVAPLDRSVVHSPSGDYAAPCGAVVSLAVMTVDRAASLCSDSSIFTTTDGARTWIAAPASPGAMNIAASADGYTVATPLAPGFSSRPSETRRRHL
jgi:hypothetical protein